MEPLPDLTDDDRRALQSADDDAHFGYGERDETRDERDDGWDEAEDDS